MPVDVDNRLTRLERVLEQYIESSAQNLADLSREMKEFKNEMKEFKDESIRSRKAMTSQIQEMNQQWGNLANKMGTVVEDIIRPGIGPTIKKYFNAELSFIGNHIIRNIKNKNLKGEFDIVATDEDHVYLVEVKSSPSKFYIDNFIKSKIPRFRKLHPEYDSKKLVPIMGSLSFTKDLVDYATQAGIYVMAYREWEYLDLLNFEEVNKISQ